MPLRAVGQAVVAQMCAPVAHGCQVYMKHQLHDQAGMLCMSSIMHAVLALICNHINI